MKTLPTNRLVATIGIWLVFGFHAPFLFAQKTYSIKAIGLLDNEHTRNDGFREMSLESLDGSGRVFGVARRFNGSSSQLGNSTWVYDGAHSKVVGLTDAAHTSSFGVRDSSIFHVSQAGKAVGTASLYNGASIQVGQSAWFFDGKSTIDLSLKDSNHTGTGGARYSDIQTFNEAGFVVGTSDRFNGNLRTGRSLWRFDGSTTSIIGFTDAAHTRNDGYKNSVIQGMLANGTVVGSSERFDGASQSGNTAWVFDGTAKRVGFTDAEHTGAGNQQSSGVSKFTQAGQFVGTSRRYSGTNDLGTTAWVYDGASTKKIGLVSSEFVRNDGYKQSEIRHVNESGVVTGHSFRYDSSTGEARGGSAWLYDGTSTTKIGLIDAQHTSSIGTQSSDATYLNSAGHVAGRSTRYSGINESGQSAWVYNGSLTSRVGFSDAAHTRNDGHQESTIFKLSNSGFAAGRSARYTGANYSGDSAWIFDGNLTRQIGLSGGEFTSDVGWSSNNIIALTESGNAIGSAARYNGGANYLGDSIWRFDGVDSQKIGLYTTDFFVRNDGVAYSVVQNVNANGDVSGVANRYDGANSIGQSAWYFDSDLDQTTELLFSVRPSDGYAYSSVSYLGEDGMVLGTYRLFDATGVDLGFRAFYFSIDDGMVELGSMVDGGLSNNGWSSLASVIRVHGTDYILGQGTTAIGTGFSPYLLTAVPEPSSMTVLLMIGFAILCRRRRL